MILMVIVVGIWETAITMVQFQDIVQKYVESKVGGV